MPFVETAKFPTAIVTVADLLNQKDKVPSQGVPTLAVSISSSALSIILVGGTGSRLPADNFRVSIEDEIINIASRSVDTLTVAASGRGADGTTAAGHSAGSAVEGRIIAKHHNQLAAEINAIETAIGVNNVGISPLGRDELLKFQVPGSNLLPNFGFERAQSSPVIPFWIKTGTGTAVVHVSSADAFTGNKCAQLARTDAAESNLWSADDLGVARVWEVVPGETYEFGAAGIQISGDALFWVGIVVFDKDGGAVTAPAVNSSSATYVKLRGFLTMPANAKYMSFRVIIAGGTVASTVRFDDAFLHRTDVDLSNFTVALLPATPVEGALAFATNGRKIGEGVGLGTGVPVYYSGAGPAGAGWYVFSSAALVAA